MGLFFSVKRKLEEKFEKIAERIITLALETADYDEERAEQFLNSTVLEDKEPKIGDDDSIKKYESIRFFSCDSAVC